MVTEQPNIPTFLASKAFDGLHVRGSAIDYDLEQLHGVNLLAQEIGVELPAPPENLTFVYRFAQPGPFRPRPDAPFAKADKYAAYIPGTELAIPLQQTPEVVTKQTILGIGKTVMQIDVGDFNRPLTYALIQSIIFPPAEDLRLFARPGAWKDQGKMAANLRVTESDRRRIRDEAVQRFSGAIALRPRS